MNDVAPKRRHRGRYVVLIGSVLIGALVVRLYLKSIVPPLVHAVRRDDLAEVRRLVEEGAQIRVSCGYADNSALHNAISKKMIDYLITAGADINAKNDRGMTPLHLAAILRNATVAEALLQHGADVHSVNDFGETPLHVAVQSLPSDSWQECGVEDHHPYRPNVGTAIPRLLVRFGADLRRLDKRGHTPLFYARKDDSAPENVVYIESLLRSGTSSQQSEWETMVINEINPAEARVVIYSPGYQIDTQVPDMVEILWWGRQLFKGKLPSRIPGSDDLPIKLIEIGTRASDHFLEVRHGEQSKRLEFTSEPGETRYFDLLKTEDGGGKTLIVERSPAKISP